MAGLTHMAWIGLGLLGLALGGCGGSDPTTPAPLDPVEACYAADGKWLPPGASATYTYHDHNSGALIEVTLTNTTGSSYCAYKSADGTWVS